MSTSPHRLWADTTHLPDEEGSVPIPEIHVQLDADSSDQWSSTVSELQDAQDGPEPHLRLRSHYLSLVVADVSGSALTQASSDESNESYLPNSNCSDVGYHDSHSPMSEYALHGLSNPAINHWSSVDAAPRTLTPIAFEEDSSQQRSSGMNEPFDGTMPQYIEPYGGWNFNNSASYDDSLMPMAATPCPEIGVTTSENCALLPDAFSGIQKYETDEKYVFEQPAPVNLQDDRGRQATQDSDEDDSSNVHTSLSKFENSSRSFACPFFRKNPYKYTDCANKKLTRIRDVKQHIQRKHCQMSNYCPVCYKSFSSAARRDGHIRSRHCKPRPPPRMRNRDAISQTTQQRLSDRVDRNLTQEEQWKTLWDILFPNDQPPDNPYMGTTVDEVTRMFRECWFTERPHIIRAFLERHGLDGGCHQGLELETILSALLDDVQQRFMEKPQRSGLGAARNYSMALEKHKSENDDVQPLHTFGCCLQPTSDQKYFCPASFAEQNASSGQDIAMTLPPMQMRDGNSFPMADGVQFGAPGHQFYCYSY
ncbi:hypothetical protein B0I35DRAFT_477828 [Stachybotrys elegans]|uniref:C2H2-type domain-containing protein n=1 Tax=Stachybotrys elegans TaxID=80388 RepID=A0A8K0SWA1_9HYPO|nr:hypothetical protein B0I35DRAFT_477828 [Stachybotrys elegans]